MDRYIGLDAHASSCTVAVVSPRGKRLGWQVVETNALRSGAGPRAHSRAAPHRGDPVPVPEQARLLGVRRAGNRDPELVLGEDPDGRVVRAEVKQTRGLNRNHNHTLKAIFKGAATTVIGRGRDEPSYCHCCRLLDGGTKTNLAKLTIARQIASIALAVWRTRRSTTRRNSRTHQRAAAGAKTEDEDERLRCVDPEHNGSAESIH